MNDTMDLVKFLNEVRAATEDCRTAEEMQRGMCRQLAHLDGYDWVGFYMVDPADENMLVLGPFVGAPTEHTRIPVSEGICGAAVAQQQTVVVDDVHADPRYISCSIETKSEIVAPIYVRGKIVGEIDIDSHEPARFTPQDRVFVEECAAIAGGWLAGHGS